jgi:AcrR family transcriptional regulator
VAQTKKKRSYNNQTRLEKSADNQRLIIDTLVDLLVERKGGVVTFEEIAERACISARSVYRLFKDKESLHRSMDEYLLSYLQASDEQISELDVAGFGRNAFQLFEKHEKLVMAYLYSPFGQELRKAFRKKLNLAMTSKILEKKKVALTKENRHKLALIVSLVNAKIWHDIKIDTGFTGNEMGPAIEWALEILIKNL